MCSFFHRDRIIVNVYVAIMFFNGTEMEQCVVFFCNYFPIFSEEINRTVPKPSKGCRNRSENLINRKISNFCIETVSPQKILLQKNIIFWLEKKIRTKNRFFFRFFHRNFFLHDFDKFSFKISTFSIFSKIKKKHRKFSKFSKIFFLDDQKKFFFGVEIFLKI